MNSKKDMRSLVESLNENLYIGLSEFIVESDENWMNERRLLGGEDARDGFKGEEGYKKAQEYFSDYLNIKDEKFVDTFKQLLDNLFHKFPEGQAPLVICYEKNHPQSFALRRWCEKNVEIKKLIENFFKKYKAYFQFINDRNKKLLPKDILKKFCGYHNTTLGTGSLTATAYEIVIATGLNIAYHYNGNVTENNFIKCLPIALNIKSQKKLTNEINKFRMFYVQIEEFLKNIVKVANQDPVLKNTKLYFRKINSGGLSEIWNNENANKTSKTDIVGYNDNGEPIIKFSIKKSSGAQAMSGAKWESLCTLQSCWNTLQSSGVLKNDNNSKEKIEFLINFFNSKEWLGNDKKRNDDLKTELYKVIKNIDDKDIRLFVYSILIEAITGGDKFEKDDIGVPNAILSWDDDDDNIYIHNIDKYINGLYNYIYSGSNDDIAKKIGEIFTINHKNHSGNVDDRYAAFRIYLPNINKIPINNNNGKFPDKQFEILFNKKLKRDLNAS